MTNVVLFYKACDIVIETPKLLYHFFTGYSLPKSIENVIIIASRERVRSEK